MKKILGLGNALVDILTILESDDLLNNLTLPKGSMQLIDQDLSSKIYGKIKDSKRFFVTGGSASNTISGLAKLGIPVGFIGKVGNDEVGSFFLSDSKKNSIESFLIKSETPSGVCISLVSPDGERTMATFLGAACEMTAEDLEQKMFSGYEYCHIEGYLVQNKDLILTAMQMAKKSGLKISLDLASYNVVEENLDFLTKITKEYVDIVFANEEEAKAFTGKEPEIALDEIATLCDIAIVKIGAKGSYIKQGNNKYKIKPLPNIQCLDSTGAGDLYASGFLYGLINGLPIEKCGEIGSLTSGNIIQVIGSKLDNKKWENIKTQIANKTLIK